ncbi:MAG TPA: hypothetical protein VLW45_04370 [Pelomicrobium sp.]|nr:hypothetical protein [Pelomicrobium sp.]
MSETAELAKIDGPPREPRSLSRRFPATVGEFTDPAERAGIDELAAWVEKRYREELRQRPSKHVYIRALPADAIERIDRLRDSPVVRDAILRHFDADWVITPMKHTDELYISHYNKDYGGDHGLFGKHYDGNLRFLPVGAVVRALIYLRSDASYRVVFADSKVEKAFATYDFGLLDFHRELHWVEGEYRADGGQRILLKCNYLVAPRHAVAATRTLLGANTAVFYVVKAAMEYSKSPRTPLQRAVGLVCNVARVLNNVHPLVPLALAGLVVAAAGYGIVRLVF